MCGWTVVIGLGGLIPPYFSLWADTILHSSVALTSTKDGTHKRKGSVVLGLYQPWFHHKYRTQGQETEAG